ncbi:MAG: DUF4058 family protein [Chloroflexi bacterium]|nr:DUF4058 family protein [Chloroflexota bacterium]
MEPYLEDPLLWHQVHFGLIHAIRTALVPMVAPRYYVSVEERTFMLTDLPVIDRVRERFLEIRATDNHELITVIEILSPSNKQPGEGRRQYEKKREQVFETLTNLVVIDLLRGGAPLPMGKLPRSHYRILVSREWERPRGALYPFNLPEALPEIPVPLRRGETEPTLALNDLLIQVYAEARYDLRIHYDRDPEPPLDDASAQWARAQIVARER